MKNQLLRSSSSTSGVSLRSNFASRFVQRFTNAAATRASFPVQPLGSLWDPYLLDRLHAPLTRHRE